MPLEQNKAANVNMDGADDDGEVNGSLNPECKLPRTVQMKINYRSALWQMQAEAFSATKFIL